MVSGDPPFAPVASYGGRRSEAENRTDARDTIPALPCQAPIPRTDEPTTPRKVAFIGLGIMGCPMAGHLARRPRRRRLQPHPSKAEAWVAEYGGRAAADAARGRGGCRRRLLLCRRRSRRAQVVVGADGAFAGMKPGAVFVDHTTASAAVARELNAAGARRAACTSSTRRCPVARPARRRAS